MTIKRDKLQRVLDYQFVSPELAERALTHRSVSKDNNERLEFLGDALLDFIIAEILFRRYPDAPEGELSRLRARMVNKSALAQVGRNLELGELVQLGAGESKSGGKHRDSILADTVEALIAAVYLDGGLVACSELVDRLTTGLQETFQPSVESKDAKTRLQEFLQARGQDLPAYSVLEVSGEAHEQVFHVECQVPVLEFPTRGSGRSKRKAEQSAAAQALARLEAET